MKRTALLGLAGFVAAISFTPFAHAQIEIEETRTPVRVGLWYNAGAGMGSLGCSTCGGVRENGFSATVTVGGTLGETFLLGAGGTFWTKSANDTTKTVAIFDARFRFYLTTPRSNLFVTLGAGVGRISAGVGSAALDAELGTGFVFGAGYDFHVNRALSITPYVHWFGAKTETLDANTVTAGLSVTVH